MYSNSRIKNENDNTTNETAIEKCFINSNKTFEWKMSIQKCELSELLG